MEKFRWANDPTPISLTNQYIVPDENKPNLTSIPVLDLPIIDMDAENEILIPAISRACEEHGFFQLTNHGIPPELCQNVLDVITEFFNLPYDKKSDMLATTHMEDGKLYKYFITNRETNENIFMWGEAFFHTWNPDDTSYIDNLPTDPYNYRKLVAEYIQEVASLITRIFGLLSQALGLNEEYLQTTFGQSNPKCTAQANYYPPCPNPELTLGLRDHTDINILTVLLADEGVPGLQVEKSGQWFAVNPALKALIVNVADQLQVLSNDKFKSVCHRVVNNDTVKRTTFGVFVGPNENTIVGPITHLLTDDNPRLYRDYKFSEFMQEFRNQAGRRRRVKEVFKMDNSGASGSSRQLN